MRRHNAKLVVVGGATAVLLAGGSTAAIAVAAGSFGEQPGRTSASCTVPRLPGSLVDVRLSDMGARMRTWTGNGFGDPGRMMGGSGPGRMMGGFGPGRMMGGRWTGAMMSVRLDRNTVPAGTVSLRVSNGGAMVHELVVLPLAGDASAGQRRVQSDATIDESGSLGEASRNCGPGEGEGLRPGGVGWTTLQLQPGRYELVCNLPGHYATGMFAELDVTE